MKKVAILGAGFTGLTAAYLLTKRKDLQVTVFEKEEKPGGLAVGYKQANWRWSLEQAYHHLFTSDHHAIDLAKELSIPVIFKRPITATYSHNKIIQLDSALSLLKYPYLSLNEKIKTAVTLGYLKLTPFWHYLEKITAREWLIKNQGEKSWKELWEPLFIGKFGKYADKIAMSWFWARIYKRSASLGYIQGGFQTLADKLAQKIKQNGGKIYYNCEINKVLRTNHKWNISKKDKPTTNNSQHTTISYDEIIATLPMPIFIKTFPDLPKNFVNKISQTQHLHALNLVLELKKPFLPSIDQRLTANSQRPYWLNINDPTFPFLAVVEHTNFMDSKYYDGNYLLYIGNYLPKEHKYFKMSAKELFKTFQPYLLKINPSYNFSLYALRFNLFIGPFAQPIIETNYSKKLPPLKTPLANLFLGNLDSVYPWDRGTNYAIELGKKLAGLIT